MSNSFSIAELIVESYSIAAMDENIKLGGSFNHVPSKGHGGFFEVNVPAEHMWQFEFVYGRFTFSKKMLEMMAKQ